MFRGPLFILSAMQGGTTPIFGPAPTGNLTYNSFWSVPGTPYCIFYDQQELLRTYSLPGSSIRSPHPRSPRGIIFGITASSFIKERQQVATAMIENLLNTILVWPRPDDLVALAQIIDTNGTYYFPGIVGMLDGWHILISGQGTECD